MQFFPKGKLLDFHSLRVRLTLGITAVAALGIGSVAIWMSSRTQSILVAANKSYVEYLARRLPQDIEIYQQMTTASQAIQKAIDHRTTGNTLIWVEGKNNQIIAQSEGLEMGMRDRELMSLTNIPLLPEVRVVNSRYWVMCQAPLIVQNQTLGELVLVQDITAEQIMFRQLLWSLGGASIAAIGLITVAIAFYVRHSLYPLEQMCNVAQRISPEQFEREQLQFENAPTEVKQLAQTLDRTLLQLYNTWEQQRQFVSNVSHELRTPLTLVSGYLQSTLKRGKNLTEAQTEALGIAATEAERTIQLLADLLDLARVDNGHLAFHLEPLILNDAIAEIVEMARQTCDRDLEFYSSEIVSAIADLNRLKQVLINLIDNAVKYSKKEVVVRLERAGEQAKITVCDRGLGIPLAQQSRIFERFYRVDEARSRSTGGTGLGLSIVKTLVEGMKGAVTVRSQPGEGSCFIVLLPLVTSVEKLK
ncbi:MAG: HAMP domain-containing sensor histidine kinase [Jaaginema sp. PMC 1079.18]|nr:HAMP domain-containing sensor histidine kinase [Jaaginema sp. PMC 1079.18]